MLRLKNDIIIGCLLPFMLLFQPEGLKDLPIQQLQHESRNHRMMLMKILLEENDYENEWEIETDKGKSKENNGGNDSSGEDGNQNQELTSDEK
ncbi:uncharacterized protein OCT59_027905 [Rhizophagus irregularis]|uniref:uncharacterized protein n=1 Tax=Rhizophagus irregularis TaxID=588596 RepID=UPI0033342A6B|nr:hypothetical protein OCT59_027905 [Rhizophagus irregularis]